MLNFEIAYRI